jgi:hypothetical protein
MNQIGSGRFDPSGFAAAPLVCHCWRNGSNLFRFKSFREDRGAKKNAPGLGSASIGFFESSKDESNRLWPI